MSGYLDIVTRDGQLVGRHTRVPPAPYGVIEEMYGMIWYLATEFNAELNTTRGPGTVEELIEEARRNYNLGLKRSPTERYKE